MNRYIEATYKLFVDNDDALQLVEETRADNPLKFYTGAGMIIKGFEDEITKFGEGDKFDFTIAKDDAYGDYHDDMVFDIPKGSFMKDGAFDSENVHENAVIPLQDENGNHFLGRVLSIDDNNVKVDLNHPLAGKDLTFSGTVLVNREASEDEIESLRHGHHHCNGHCHHDGDGECSGHCHHDGGGECNGHCHNDEDGDGGCCGNCGK